MLPIGSKLLNLFVSSPTPWGTITFPPGSPEVLPSLLPNISSLTFVKSSPHSTLRTRENPDNARSTSLRIWEEDDEVPILDDVLLDSNDFLMASNAFRFLPL